MSRPSEFERHAFLASRPPLEAARLLVDGEFYMDEEPALCFAIRRHEGVDLGDDAVLDILFEMLDEADGGEATATPEAFIERLVAESRR